MENKTWKPLTFHKPLYPTWLHFLHLCTLCPDINFGSLQLQHVFHASPGLFVYFGYGIWHSKEGMRELQPKDMAARYVVLPNGSLVETVQTVQPDGQVDAAHHINPSTDLTAEEHAGKRWCVTKHRSGPLPGIVSLSYALLLLEYSLYLTPIACDRLLALKMLAHHGVGCMLCVSLWSIFVYLVILECTVESFITVL